MNVHAVIETAVILSDLNGTVNPNCYTMGDTQKFASENESCFTWESF